MITNEQKNKQPLSPEIIAGIDKEIKKYPAGQRQSAVLQALKLVQAENSGTLTVKWMDAIAAYLQMPAIAVYEVASFYSMYNLEPVGRHTIGVCNSISCLLRGSEQLLAHVKKKHPLDKKGNSCCGKFTLKEVECLGACVDAPAVQIDEQYHEKLSPEQLDKLIEALD